MDEFVPDVLVIGAMKAATTGVCEWLAAQRGIAVSEPKEPGVFVSDESRRAYVGRWQELFLHSAPGDLLVDGSTFYSKFPSITGVPHRVAEVAPDTRIVFVLRHPFDRMLSQYTFDWLRGVDRSSFSVALRESPSLLTNSMYALQLDQWLQYFPPDQICLVLTESFAVNPEKEVRRVMTHVGINSDGSIAAPERSRSNVTAGVRSPSRTRYLFSHLPAARRLRSVTPSLIVRLYRAHLQKRSRPVVTAELRHEIEQELDADLARLQQLTAGPALTCASWNRVALSWTPSLAPPPM